MDLSRETMLEMLEKMHIARAFENKVAYFFAYGMVHGTTHLSIGQEASAVGACYAINKDDYIISTHRGHSHCVAKGADLNKMVSEFLGKETGYCKGKGGSMHIADIASGNLGANGVVGGGIPLATGAALTCKMKNNNKIVLCFFGDGASNQGSFHEAINLASVWKLPVIFLCENNLYGMSNHVKDAMNIENIADRGSAYGIPSYIIDGNNLQEVYETTKSAAEYVREGNGPILIEAKTYRWMGHSKSDANSYRTKEEIEQWKEKCPIRRFTEYLIKEGHLTQAEADQIEKKAKQAIEEATKFAEESPYPSIDTILDDVYA